MEIAGYLDLMLSEDTCIYMKSEFRLHLPRTVSLAIEFFFPLVFPQDPLIGRSNPDTQMVVKLDELFRELCNPPSERQLPDIFGRIVQGFIEKPGTQPGENSNKRKLSFAQKEISLKRKSRLGWAQSGDYDPAVQVDPPVEEEAAEDGQFTRNE